MTDENEDPSAAEHVAESTQLPGGRVANSQINTTHNSVLQSMNRVAGEGNSSQDSDAGSVEEPPPPSKKLKVKMPFNKSKYGSS